MSGIDARSDAIYELAEEGSAVEQLATGFTFTEGPIWHPGEQVLYFSDMPPTSVGRYARRHGDRGQKARVQVQRDDPDADHNLLVCEHVYELTRPRASRRHARDARVPLRGQVPEQPERRDRPLRRHDLLLRPVVRAVSRFGVERARELGWQGVFRIPPRRQDELQLAVDQDEFEMPNGLRFSPDESLLYINDTPGAHIKVFNVASDGTLANGRMFFDGIGTGVIEEGIPDGMKGDERGNIWVTGPKGVWVISPEGEHLGTVIAPPREHRQSLLGRPGLAHPVHPVEYVGLHDHDDGRPAARAVHALGGNEMADYTLTRRAARSSSRTCRTT